MRTRVLLVALALAGCTGAQEPPPLPTASTVTTPASPAPPLPWPPAIALEPYLAGLERPLLLLEDGAARRFVVEQGGLVRLVRDGRVAERAFADLRELTTTDCERGLLGMALDPGFASNGRVYLSYTDNAGDSVLARYLVAPGDADAVDPASAETLLHVDQPYCNHNGGHIAFGPDGFLYYGLGDGGLAGDPHGNAQDPDALLGSLLRLDVRGASGYAIPPDNPYAAGGGAGEVWAKGLRNPWRFSFDRATGDLYVADVGQGQYEEVDFQPASSKGGENYGWNAFEGLHAFSPVTRPFSPVTAPVAEYSHDDGCSVSGGFVYRGTAFPALVGTYLFGDYCSGKLWLLKVVDGAWRMELALDTTHRIVSFGEDAVGEVYVIDHGGSVLRVAAAPS